MCVNEMIGKRAKLKYLNKHRFIKKDKNNGALRFFTIFYFVM